MKDSPETSDVSTTLSNTASSRSTSTTPNSNASFSLRDEYIDTICRVGGSSLKHLIFPVKWPISSATVARVIRACPNLTQLSASIECENLEIWKILVPFLKSLWAMRLDIIGWYGCEARDDAAPPKGPFAGSPEFRLLLCRLLSNGDYNQLRYLGVGPTIYEVVGWEDVVEQVPLDGEGTAFREEVVRLRKVVEVTREDVKEVAIWKYDTLDVI